MKPHGELLPPPSPYSLAQFADVRGIRIEDDVLVTETGSEVLTAELPTYSAVVEQLVRG